MIAVSANTFPGAAPTEVAGGYFRHLVKPFDLVDLMDAVDAALDKGKGRGAP